MALQLEPKGLLFAEIKFLNPMITRKPKLRRQRKIFRQQGKMPRPDQMNINVATWGRLLKRNLNFQKSVGPGGSADTNNHAKDATASNMHPESSSASRQDNTSATGEWYIDSWRLGPFFTNFELYSSQFSRLLDSPFDL